MTTPYTVVLGGLTMGAGTVYEIDAAGIDGLGTPVAKTQDVVYNFGDGSYGNPDHIGPRVILIPFNINDTSDTNAWADLALLAAVWAPVAADVQIDIILASATWSYMGRPRSLEAHTQYAQQGVITAIGEFHALNPVAL